MISEPLPDIPTRSRRPAALIVILGVIICTPLIWLLFRGLSMDPHRMDAPLVGHISPDFSLRRLADDSLITADSLRGKPLVLNFWATWCIPCRQEHPTLVWGAKRFARAAHFIGIVYQDRKESVREWLDHYGGRAYPTLIDVNAKAAIAYGVYGVPETYFIDSEGQVISKFVGPMSRQDLVTHLSGVVAKTGQRPKTAKPGPPAQPPHPRVRR